MHLIYWRQQVGREIKIFIFNHIEPETVAFVDPLDSDSPVSTDPVIVIANAISKRKMFRFPYKTID